MNPTSTTRGRTFVNFSTSHWSQTDYNFTLYGGETETKLSPKLSPINGTIKDNFNNLKKIKSHFEHQYPTYDFEIRRKT